MTTSLKPEQWLYLVFVGTLPFATLPELAGYEGSVQIADVVFLLTGIVWFGLLLVRKRGIVWSPAFVFLAAYAIAVTLSAIFSVRPEQSVVKLAGKFYLIAIVFLTVNIVTSLDFLKTLLRVWLTASALVILLNVAGIAGFYLGSTDPASNLVLHPIFGSLPPGDYPRIEGFFAYPSMLCNYLSITAAFLVMSASMGWMSKRIAMPFGIALVIVDAFTLTPGLGGIFLAAGIFVWMVSTRPAIGPLALAGGVLIAAAAFFAASVTLFSPSPNGVNSPLAAGELSPSHRAEAWRTSFRSFVEDPILGRGTGIPVADSRFVDPSGNYQLLTDAHNIYLSVLGETGLVGFVAFGAILVFLLAGLGRSWPIEHRLQFVPVVLLIALIDAGLYQGLTGSYEDTRHLWALFGIAAAAICLTEAGRERNDINIATV